LGDKERESCEGKALDSGGAELIMIDEQVIRDNLNKILNSREFVQPPSESPLSNAIDRLLESIWEWIKQLFQRYLPERNLHIDPSFNNEFVGVLKFILIAVGVVLVFLIIRLIIKRVYMPAKRKKSKLPNVSDYVEREDEVIEKIQALIEQKEYTAALCFLFIAVLLEFNKKRIIKVEKWKTNRVYIREIKQNAGEFLAQMSEFSSIFNRCRYGGREADETVINTWFEFFLRLREI
jgi:hypothetical protein